MQWSKKLVSFDSINQLSQLNDYLTEFYNHYFDQKLLLSLHKETWIENWHCYECKAPIEVDIRALSKKTSKWNSSSLFCTEHKINCNQSMNSVVFARYENTFFSHIKNKILDSSI